MSMDDLSFVQYPASLNAILDRTAILGFKMASEPRTGALLRALAASKPSGRILELGTGTGVSTSWLLCGMDPRATLISVDTDPQAQGVARDFLGSDERVSFVLEDDRRGRGKQAGQLQKA